MSNFPNKILLGLQEGSCNLKCPKCFTHSPDPISSLPRKSGYMDFSKFTKLLDEIASKNPKARVTAQTWDEPFLHPKLLDYIAEIKKRNLFCSIDTNGILLNEENAKALVLLEVDSIFISLDAFTPELYQEIRGLDKLDHIKKNILKLIKVRSDNKFPRIGVSYVQEEKNKHEVELFIDEWAEKVDCIRVNKIFEKDRSVDIIPTERYSCWSLEDSIMIACDGSVGLCCVDTHYQNEIGNAFESGLENVWMNSRFNKIRSKHSEGKFGDVSICKDCSLWKNDDIIREDREKVIVAKSSTHTYYNNKKRLNNLTENRFLKDV